MKIATWNVNSLNVRLPHVLQWLADQQPDIVALQETKVIDEKFPHSSLAEAGYQAIYSGQKTYNGVALLAKTVAHDIVTDIPQLNDPQRRIIAATYDNLRVINLYVPNGASVDSEKYHYKLDWLVKVTDYINEQIQQYPKLVILGDFNIAPDERDVHDPIAWQGCVLVSPRERQALQTLLGLGLNDAYRLLYPEQIDYSWWDYRQAAFRRNRGLRIDLILLSKALMNVCQAVAIDKTPRSWEQPSDHTPVMVEFSQS